MRVIFWTINREEMRQELLKYSAQKQFANPSKSPGIVEPLKFQSLVELAKEKGYLKEKGSNQ